VYNSSSHARDLDTLADVTFEETLAQAREVLHRIEQWGAQVCVCVRVCVCVCVFACV
jgi:hypothetical protein